MKKLITIFGVAALLFGGCSNPVETSLDPVNLDQNSFSKEIADVIVNPAVLPTELFTSKEISGRIGGTIELNGYFKNAYGDTVLVAAKLVIPRGAFSGTKVISIRTDKSRPGLEFQPASVFSQTLKLNLSFKGMSTERYSLKTNETGFAYLADNGFTSELINDGISVDSNTKFLKVIGANITHFSRYSFIRKTPRDK